MNFIETIENTLAGIGSENVAVDWREYVEYCDGDECKRYPFGKFADGFLMPDGRCIIHRQLRRVNMMIQGHSSTANWLLGADPFGGDDGLKTLLKAGFIRMAYGEDYLPCLDFRVEPTDEQYAFIEMLDFESGVQIDIKLPFVKGGGNSNSRVHEKHSKHIGGADVADALKEFYAKGCRADT